MQRRVYIKNLDNVSYACINYHVTVLEKFRINFMKNKTIPRFNAAHAVFYVKLLLFFNNIRTSSNHKMSVIQFVQKVLYILARTWIHFSLVMQHDLYLDLYISYMHFTHALIIM